MLASIADAPFSRDGWIFEPKLDGMRGLAIINNGRCKMLSRNGRNFTAMYPALITELGSIPGEMVLDGEIVAVNEEGRPTFERLQERMFLRREKEILLADVQNQAFFYAFDIMYIDGWDLTRLPLRERKQILRDVLKDGYLYRRMEHFENNGLDVYNACVQQGFEGMMAKFGASTYTPGRRSRHWIKVKHYQSAEFLVGGYRDGLGFLLGRYGKDGRLHYAGSVGLGFNSRSYDHLKDSLNERSTSPFVERVGLGATWFEPEIVIEVKFTEFTSNGLLRLPVFKAMRDGIHPHDIRI
jgi:bifunctional non-homologous end joining protein LigD